MENEDKNYSVFMNSSLTYGKIKYRNKEWAFRKFSSNLTLPWHSNLPFNLVLVGLSYLMGIDPLGTSVLANSHAWTVYQPCVETD